MVEPVTGHPAADRATSEALIVEQDRGVVPLSTWVANAAVEATETGRVLQVLTPAHSRITYPLELLLRDAAGQWVLREGAERFRDGIGGFPLRWNGQRFVTVLNASPPADADLQPDSGDLEVQISTLHPGAESLRLGASTEIAMQVLTGVAPAGWGIAEPATQPWLPPELTEQCRERAPDRTQLVVVGSDVIGQLYVQWVDTGVLERTRLSGPPISVLSTDIIDTLAAEIADTARSMIVAAQPGRRSGLRTSRPTPPALPSGILIGHELVAERGVAHAQATPAQVSLLGRGAGKACWCRLDDGQHAPFELLTAVLQHFGLTAAT
jgi:hypothetical protein